MMDYVRAMRPQTLIIGIMPVGLSFLLAKQHGQNPSLFYLGCCLAVGLLLQICSNLFNDVIDAKKGADNNRIGDNRLVASGRLKAEKVTFLALSLMAMAFLSSIPLILNHYLYLPLGLAAMYFSFGYTGGPYALAYNGLGELFAFLFFGPVATCGTYYALTSSLTAEIIFLSFALGFGAALILGLNNLRDYNEDKKAGKNTLAVKTGLVLFKKYLMFFILGGLISQRFLLKSLGKDNWIALPAILAMTLAYLIMSGRQEQEYRIIFKLGLISFLLNSLLLGGLLWGDLQ